MTIETKFSVGDKVWTIYGNRPQEMSISIIVIRICKNTVIDYFLHAKDAKDANDSYFEASEEYVFATKTELLAYWA